MSRYNCLLLPVMLRTVQLYKYKSNVASLNYIFARNVVVDFLIAAHGFCISNVHIRRPPVSWWVIVIQYRCFFVLGTVKKKKKKTMGLTKVTYVVALTEISGWKFAPIFCHSWFWRESIYSLGFRSPAENACTTNGMARAVVVDLFEVDGKSVRSEEAMLLRYIDEAFVASLPVNNVSI